MKRISLSLALVLTSAIGFSQIGVNEQSSYDYPFLRGDKMWQSFKCAKDRILALQIPDSVICTLPTKTLVGLCLDFPYLTDMYAFDNPQAGFEYLISEYNGYDELLKREDAINELLAEYRKIESADSMLSNVSEIERGSYSFRCDLLVNLIRHIGRLKGFTKSMSISLSNQTARNAEVLKKHPELFGTMCKEAIFTSCRERFFENSRTTWYEGEIVQWQDGRQYQLLSKRTPSNSVVIAGTLITSDYDNAEKSALAYSVQSNYNVTIVSPATRKYNCHSYAWHMYDMHANDEVWIGLKSAQDEDIYWTDGSYYSVAPSQATHVSYTNEHSAIRLPNGLYRSKWGALPLVEHDSLETPSYGIPSNYYKKFMPKITGPSFICSNGIYSIGFLPQDYSVMWKVSDTYYNAYCIQSNYPSTGQCTISHNSSHDMVDATLTATILYNGDTVRVLTMPGINAYNDFRGYYTSGNVSGNINYSHYFHVKVNNTTHISSPNLTGASASYDSNYTIPSFWEFDPFHGYINMVMPSTNSNYPIKINVEDVCGNHYQLYAVPSNSIYLSVSNVDGNISISLGQKSEAADSDSMLSSWKYDIINSVSGEIMVTASSTARSALVSSIGWPDGMYVVKITVGDEVITGKIIINNS